MIANFFRKSKPINTLLIIAFLVFVYGISSFTYIIADITLSTFFKSTLMFLLLLVMLFGLNFIITKNNLTKDNSYALLLYVFLLGMFSFSMSHYKIAIINLILFLSYRRIYSLRTNKDTKEKLFDSAFWIGIATLLYPWCSLLLLLIFIALFLFDKSTWRNVLIPIVGFVCPIFIYSIYLMLISDSAIFENMLNFESDFLFAPYNSLRILAPMAVIFGLLLWAVFPTSYKINLVNNEFKSSWFLLINHLLILILITLPWKGKTGGEMMFLFFPLVIIFTNYLQIVEEKWFKEVFLYVLFGLTLGVQFL